MSRIDLTHIETEPLEFAQDLTLPAGTGGEEVVSAPKARIAGTVECAGGGAFLVHGTIDATLELRCVRCLTSFPLSVSEDVDLRLEPAASAPREEEVRLGRDELEVHFYGAPALELAELAAEQVELAVPMKPVCHEDCRGLCPKCGANLNLTTCDCSPDTDERWGPLAGWRSREH